MPQRGEEHTHFHVMPARYQEGGGYYPSFDTEEIGAKRVLSTLLKVIDMVGDRAEI